jgi:hypothetical protein
LSNCVIYVFGREHCCGDDVVLQDLKGGSMIIKIIIKNADPYTVEYERNAIDRAKIDRRQTENNVSPFAGDLHF